MADRPKRKMPTERQAIRNNASAVMDSSGTGDPAMDAVLRGETQRKNTQRAAFSPYAGGAKRVENIFTKVHDLIFKPKPKK